ncbi:MAG: peptidase U32 family protein [Lachnospiraceae bacterium]|jgi:putative protease
MKKPELLAPAGSYDIMKTAFKAGADAVYIGGRLFGARAYADNPDQDMLLRAIDYAHLHGRRLYLTVNTLVKNQELEEMLPAYIEPLCREGLDAVLVQDYGILDYLHRYFPSLPLHASTQMTVCTPAFGRALRQYGVTRIVMPRELNLQEIAQIKQETGLDTEVFIHGALCYCYSGQCLMSSMIGGRSGNRGRCAQPCRQPYTAEGGGLHSKGYLLCPKDLCGLEMLPALISAGADSLKIEGRMKSAEYVAGSVSIYRKYIDQCLSGDAWHVDEEDVNVLLELFNRGGFTDGYFRRHNGAEMMSVDRPNHQGLAVGTAKVRAGRSIITVKRNLKDGDLLELPGGQTYKVTHPAAAGTELTIPPNQHAAGRKPQSGTVYRVRSEALLRQLHSRYVQAPDLQEDASAAVQVRTGEPLILRVSHAGTEVSAAGDVVQKAQKRPVSEEDIRRQLSKTGGTPYRFTDIKTDLSGDAFIPLGQLNELRRTALDGLTGKELSAFRRDVVPAAEQSDEGRQKADNVSAESRRQAGSGADASRIGVLVSDEEQLQIVLQYDFADRIYLDLDGDRGALSRMAESVREHGRSLYFGLPYIIRGERADTLQEDLAFAENLSPDGYLVRSFDGLFALRGSGIKAPAAADWNVYAMNDRAGRMIAGQVSQLTLPAELNRNELHRLAFYHEGELIVYGRQQLMTSAGCIRRTAGRCTHVPGTLTLTDRKNVSFPVRCVCRYCYNLIYNSAPVFLDEETALFAKGQGPARIRLHFTDEDAHKTRQVMEIYRRLLAGESVRPDFIYTKGHYNRGVE